MYLHSSGIVISHTLYIRPHTKYRKHYVYNHDQKLRKRIVFEQKRQEDMFLSILQVMWRLKENHGIDQRQKGRRVDRCERMNIKQGGNVFEYFSYAQIERNGMKLQTSIKGHMSGKETKDRMEGARITYKYVPV